MKRSAAFGLPLCVWCFTGCSDDGDYQVAVSWLINGTTPDAAMCQEQGIARGRLDVSDNGRAVRSVEADCASTVEIYLEDQYATYGGFMTTHSFEWDRRYQYTLAMVDAAGTPVSEPAAGEFALGYDVADVYQLNYLDYVQPFGGSAGLYGDWNVRSGDLAANCTAEGIQTVRIDVGSALDTGFEDWFTAGEAPCSAGQFRSPGKLLATGDYLFQYVALRADSSVAEAGEPIHQFVDGSKDIALPREIFLAK